MPAEVRTDRASPPAADAVGSAGLGPIVQRALDGSDPLRAMEVASLTAACCSPVPVAEPAALLLSADPKGRGECLPDLLHHDRREARRGQTLTPKLRTRELELLQAVLRWGQEEAAP